MAPVLAELKIVDKWRAADLRGENQTASPPPAIITPLTAERLAGLTRLDAGAARHRAGIEGLAAERPTGNGPGTAAPRIEGLAADRATGIGPGAAAAGGGRRFSHGPIASITAPS
jgi:hypothetical protein